MAIEVSDNHKPNFIKLDRPHKDLLPCKECQLPNTIVMVTDNDGWNKVVCLECLKEQSQWYANPHKAVKMWNIENYVG